MRLRPAAPLAVLSLALFALAFAESAGRVLPARAPAPPVALRERARAVVLGADGVDFHFLARYLEEDRARPPSGRRLPHLLRLADQGGLHVLRSEIPPESPVAWASLLTGVNPARHRVFDFVRPGAGYRPENGMVDVRRMRLLFRRVPVRPPVVKRRLAAPTFLERLHAEGFPILSLREPLAFPVRPLPGSRVLSGLGTPDVAGGAGFYTVYSSRPAFPSGDTVFGGVQIPLDPDRGPRHETTLPGPFDPSRPRPGGRGLERTEVPIAFEVLAGREPPALAVHLQGRTALVPYERDPATGAMGARSEFLPVTFTLGTIPPVPVRAFVRFEVKRLDPLVVLADPVHLSPIDAPFPLTSPRGYGADLVGRHGPFETVGWAEQTFALNDGYQDDEGFLRDLLEDLDRGAGLLLGELDREAACAFQVFTATDRALHCFLRYYDPEHPAHAAGRREALGDPILRVFSRFDRIVGDVAARLGPDDLLLVCSDHGFQTWRWGVNLNAWLVREGYLVLTKEAGEASLADYFGGGVLGADVVDWSRTRAYAMGLGQVYVNRADREERGIVLPGDAAALAREIREGLLRLANPLRPDDRPVADVYLLHEIYAGPYLHEAPELQLGFAPGYRVSWQTALLGGMGRPLFEANDYPWSADHCSTDVTAVPGVLLANRPLGPAPADRPHHVRDVAATVLRWFGVEAGDLDGRALPLAYPSPR